MPDFLAFAIEGAFPWDVTDPGRGDSKIDSEEIWCAGPVSYVRHVLLPGFVAVMRLP